MVITINVVSLNFAAEQILPEVTEVTDTVDNIDDRTHLSLKSAVWFPSNKLLLIKEKPQKI